MSEIFLTVSPSIDNIISPSRANSLPSVSFVSVTPSNPAVSAGLPSITDTTKNPLELFNPLTSASSGSTSVPEIPIHGCLNSPS